MTDPEYGKEEKTSVDLTGPLSKTRSITANHAGAETGTPTKTSGKGRKSADAVKKSKTLYITIGVVVIILVAAMSVFFHLSGVPLAGMVNGSATGPIAANGDTVGIFYTVSFENGTVFATTMNTSLPLVFTLGNSSVIPGIQKAVIGMWQGETKTVDIPYTDAYGVYNPGLVQTIDRTGPFANVSFIVGESYTIHYGASDRNIKVWIINVTPKTVTWDANNPLAGYNLTYTIKLANLTEAPAAPAPIARVTEFVTPVGPAAPAPIARVTEFVTPVGSAASAPISSAEVTGSVAPVAIAAPRAITSVGVTGFVVPVAGAAPVSLSALASSDPAQYTVTSLTWTPSPMTFAASGEYTATVVLTAASNYTFPSSSSITPMVDTGTVGTGMVSGNGPGNTFTFAVSFPPAVVPATTAITSAGVTGFEAPVAGATPVSLSALASNDPAQYTVTSLIWSPSATSFTASNEYTATVVLTAASNYTFPAYSPITPTVDAGTAGIGMVSGNGPGNTLTFTVNFPAAVAPAPITSVGVTGFVAPVTGAAPVSLSALASNNPAQYTVTSLIWSPSATSFAASGQYTATVFLTAAPSYTFPVSSSIIPTVDAGTASTGMVSGDGPGNTLMFTINFPAAPAVAV
jgi:peptidylprolyl isomerase